MSRRAGNEKDVRPSRTLRRLSRSSGVVGSPGRRARLDGPGGHDVVDRPHPARSYRRCRSRGPRRTVDHGRRAADERRLIPFVADDRVDDRADDRTARNRAFGCRLANARPIDGRRDSRPDRGDRPGGRYRWRSGDDRHLPGRCTDHQLLDQPTGADHDDDRPRGPDVRRLPGVPRRRLRDLPDRRRSHRFGHCHLDGDTDTFTYDHMHKPPCIKNWPIWHIAGSYR